MKFSTRAKILITIVAATLYWLATEAYSKYTLPQPRPAAAMTPQRDLEIGYAELNKGFYGDTLPHDVTIKMVHNLVNSNGDDIMGDSLCYPTTPIHCTVRINIEMNPAQVTRYQTLYHESCHIYLYGTALGHGEPFQDCMKNLAAMGAFRDIW